MCIKVLYEAFKVDGEIVEGKLYVAEKLSKKYVLKRSY